MLKLRRLDSRRLGEIAGPAENLQVFRCAGASLAPRKHVIKVKGIGVRPAPSTAVPIPQEDLSPNGIWYVPARMRPEYGSRAGDLAHRNQRGPSKTRKSQLDPLVLMELPDTVSAKPDPSGKSYVDRADKFILPCEQPSAVDLGGGSVDVGCVDKDAEPLPQK